MSVYRFEDKTPAVHPTAFIAPGAYVVGAVEVAQEMAVQVVGLKVVKRQMILEMVKVVHK